MNRWVVQFSSVWYYHNICIARIGGEIPVEQSDLFYSTQSAKNMEASHFFSFCLPFPPSLSLSFFLLPSLPPFLFPLPTLPLSLLRTLRPFLSPSSPPHIHIPPSLPLASFLSSLHPLPSSLLSRLHPSLPPFILE